MQSLDNFYAKHADKINDTFASDWFNITLTEWNDGIIEWMFEDMMLSFEAGETWDDGIVMDALATRVGFAFMHLFKRYLGHRDEEIHSEIFDNMIKVICEEALPHFIKAVDEYVEQLHSSRKEDGGFND